MPYPTVPPVLDRYRNFFHTLSDRPSFKGRINYQDAERVVYSTDNSIYQILPQGCISPTCMEDLQVLFRVASSNQFLNVSFTARGGGTGTNGQSLNNGVSLDCRSQLNQILELNMDEGWVRVQSGVVLDQLNDYLRPHGVCFAPSVAPSSRATIGGMINTDACGKGSRIYGRTSDHIQSMVLVLSDGTLWDCQHSLKTPVDQLLANNGIVGDLVNHLSDWVPRHQDLIQFHFPDTPRFLSGYNVAKLFDASQNQWAFPYLVAGSEGSLGVVAEATLRVTPLPKYSALCVLQYPTFRDAIRSNESLLSLNPHAIEMMDETLLQLAERDSQVKSLTNLLDMNTAINLVEFHGATQDDLDSQIHSMNAWAKSHMFPVYSTQDPEEILAWWGVRKEGVGILGRMPTVRRPVPFIEDTVVPVAQLPFYMDGLESILEKYELFYGIYGHADVGCVHVRPALDLSNPADQALLKPISDEVFSLVQAHQGVMFGEHGRGHRSQYTSQVFGPELTGLFKDIKTHFDFHNRLNPGDIVTSHDSDDSIKSVLGPLRGQLNQQIPFVERDMYPNIFHCNGNGVCLSLDSTRLMCPSYQVTETLQHSPKGRADLIREWVRQQGNRRPLRWYYLFRSRLDRPFKLFDRQVYDALDGCLSCKGCANQCPVQVNIPESKSRFLHGYYQFHQRPLRDYLFLFVEPLLPVMSIIPGLMNFLMSTILSQFFIKRGLGLVEMPTLSPLWIQNQLRKRRVLLKKGEQLKPMDTHKLVVLIQDPWTRFYDAQVFIDTVDLLIKLGYMVKVLPYFNTGKSSHVKGFLESFEKTVHRNITGLNQVASKDMVVLGIEPSVVMLFRDEYPQYANGLELSCEVKLLQEWLSKISLHRVRSDHRYVLLGHCMEYDGNCSLHQLWEDVFFQAGLCLRSASVGCCGMAGAFGHDAHHQDMSQRIYGQSWGPVLEGLEEDEIPLATGFSCRSQVKRFGGQSIQHPIQILKTLLD